VTVADLLDERERGIVAAAVPTVDPRSVRVLRMPEWYRRITGIRPDAVTMGGRVLVAEGVSGLERCARTALLAHELAHVAQQRSGRLGFAFAYGATYLVARLGGRSHVDAYRAIPAESLAREVQRRVLAACRAA